MIGCERQAELRRLLPPLFLPSLPPSLPTSLPGSCVGLCAEPHSLLLPVCKTKRQRTYSSCSFDRFRGRRGRHPNTHALPPSLPPYLVPGSACAWSPSRCYRPYEGQSDNARTTLVPLGRFRGRRDRRRSIRSGRESRLPAFRSVE